METAFQVQSGDDHMIFSKYGPHCKSMGLVLNINLMLLDWCLKDENYISRFPENKSRCFCFEVLQTSSCPARKTEHETAWIPCWFQLVCVVLVTQSCCSQAKLLLPVLIPACKTYRILLPAVLDVSAGHVHNAHLHFLWRWTTQLDLRWMFYDLYTIYVFIYLFKVPLLCFL